LEEFAMLEQILTCERVLFPTGTPYDSTKWKAWQTLKSAVLAQQADNSDYAAAIRIFHEWADAVGYLGGITFCSWCEERLHSAKSPNDA
jgi:hypothetical protein